VSVYLDASVLVALLTDDPLTRRADAFLRANAPILNVSDFAAAEFAAVIARHVRTRDITVDNARVVFSTFDAWTARATQRVEINPADITSAAAFLRRLDLIPTFVNVDSSASLPGSPRQSITH
jgi:uncharacterized protein